MTHTPFLDAMEQRLRREYSDRCPAAPPALEAGEAGARQRRPVQLNDGEGRRERIIQIEWCANFDLPRALIYHGTAYLLQSVAGARFDGERIPTYWSAYTECVDDDE
jgi:hypothetical protein